MYSLIKTNIKANLNRLANRFGYEITRIDHQRYFSFQALLNYCLNVKQKIHFVQVGGCDGTSFDPLYKSIVSKPGKFKGIILEPVDAYFWELEATYKGFDAIQPLRYAVHNEKKYATLYRPDLSNSGELPDYAKGVASFDLNHLKKFNIPPDHILEESVPCIDLNIAIEKYCIGTPDLLLLDTEGYDAEILLNFDFAANKPSIIRFEHGVPDGIMGKDQLESVLSLLHAEGYEVVLEHYDATAYQRELFLRGIQRC